MTLPAISTDSGKFVLLDSDLPLDLASRLGLAPATDQLPLLAKVIDFQVSQLSPHTTGVILGPEVGFESILKKTENAGLLLSINRTLMPPDPANTPSFLSNWGVEHIRNNYGWVRLQLYYHPDEKLANDKRQIVAEIFDHCRYEGTSLLLELNVYPAEDTQDTLEAFSEAQLWSARELQSAANLLALDYAGDALSCATLTAQLDLPWLLLDKSDDYTQQKDQLRVAMESGAKGVIMGKSLLSGLGKLSKDQLKRGDLSKVEAFMVKDGRDRVIELARIVEETV